MVGEPVQHAFCSSCSAISALCDQAMKEIAFAKNPHGYGKMPNALVSGERLSEQNKRSCLIHARTLAQVSHNLQAHFG